ncbi:hypothetical protein DFQ28_009666 [Apophysomyces sp. BC1034]|nr:hypothetical protein DFQ30_009915 [Apophysomyces sp. BC1015]KAG0182092.1 hypothetical protein DFQ29_005786 [Apophysomyces sp. BC1021]KAG0192261.1 hypothetical protein DFQ28_009666 [Apophysomyces sp. BC1034]
MSVLEKHRRQSIYGSGVVATDEFKVGARVLVHGENVGTVRFVGSTSFQTGKWVGIELDEPLGKNGGVVQGKRYFDCPANHGMFVRPSQIKVISSTSTTSSENDPPRSSQVDARRASRRQSMAATSPQSSRISTPARTSPLQLQQQRRKSQAAPAKSRPNSLVGAVPQSSVTIANNRRKSISVKQQPTATTTTTTTTTRPRSNTQGALSQRPRSNTQSSIAVQRDAKETREKQLQQLRLLQQQKAQFEEEQRQKQLEEEEQQRQLEEEEKERQLEEERRQRQLEEAQRKRLLEEAQRRKQLEEAQAQLDVESEEETIFESHTEEQEDTPSDTEISEEDTLQTPADFASPDPIDEDSRNQQLTYGSLAATTPKSKSEQTVPFKEYEELRFKLKILENKRHEDRERYRDYEKAKEEAEQFLTLRNKLQDKVGDLQKDLRDTKRELKESKSDNETLENKYHELLEALEMMTLDKEVAEERAENLQQEVAVLKDKIEEISVDLDVLRKETDILNRPPELNSEERTPLEVVQLERHNERLKEALLRLRDAATEQENELNQRIKSLEDENYELEDLKLQHQRIKEKLETAEIQIEDLKQQLDDALGSEDLVDQLTDKNLILNEKLEELQATVDDLEALRELADELEENHMETEKQLQAEIDHRDMLLREQLERIKSSEETNADYESTIQQFRELVVNLQSDLDQLRLKEVNEQSEKQVLSSQSQAMMSLNLQLQSTVMKTQAKAIDLELRKLDAAQATDRLSYIQPYLPDVFFKTENDPISCLLLFKRMVFKSELIIKHLDQSHPISEKIMEKVTESLISVCEVRQKAGWISDLSKRFVTFIKHCNPDTFVRMSRVYQDLVGTERRLNAIVELFRTEEVNESECLVELQRVISQLEHLTEVYLLESGETNNEDQFFGLTRALDLNADRMTIELTFIKQTVDDAARVEGISIAEGLEYLDYNYLEPLNRLIVQSKNTKVVARKLLRRLEDLSEQALTLKAEHLHRFKTLYAISSKLSRFCFESYKQITTHVNAKRGSKEDLRLAEVQQIIYNNSEEILEIAESSMWEGGLKTLKSLISELGTTLTRVENDNKMDKIATRVPPWIQRASDIKAEVVVNHDMERRLQQHNEEIVKLIKDIKMKDQALQESSVKVDLLEKRMEIARKEADQVGSLEESLQKAQEQEQIYAEAMENLQLEYNTLQQKNAELRISVNKKEEKRLSAQKKAFELGETSLDNEATDTGSQMETLRAAIRYLRAENAHLKAASFTRDVQLDDLPDVVQYELDDTREVVRSIATETRVLVKDIRIASASPKVVKLSPPVNKWSSMKNSPNYQYQGQQSALYTLKQRSSQLQRKVEQLQAHDKLQTPTTSNRKEIIPLVRSLAKIQIPCAPSSIGSSGLRCVQLRSAAEFERIHNVFIRSPIPS